MRVLHLIDSGGLYGAEKMLLSLVQEQVKQGLEPMILSAGEPGIEEKPIEAEAKKKRLPVTTWRMRPGLNLRESWNILKWAQQNRYDLLHSHGFKFNVLLGMYPERFRRIPMVATLHGYLNAPKFSRLWIYETLDQYSFRRMRGVVLVGEAMKKQLPEKLSGNGVVVIPNGLNIPELRAASSRPLVALLESFYDKHEVVILGVGRLSPEKGFDRLISAFAELKMLFPNLGLVIVGEGRLRPKLEALAGELGIEDDVLMPGYCATVPALMMRSHALVMPSLTEGLPITLLEAMSLKTPVVASAVGEIPKVLGGGRYGELMPDSDPSTIFGSIEPTLKNLEKSNLKANEAAIMVNANYSSEAMSQRYLEYYKEILSEK